MYNLIIVAHPDDEVFWMGANLAARRDEKWHIICVTHNAKTPRGYEFRRLCKRYDWSFHQLGFTDGGKANLILNYEKLLSVLYQELRALKARNFIKHIYTHGHRGEYGHGQHRQIHQAVRQVIRAIKYRGAIDYFQWDAVQGIIEPHQETLLPEHFIAKKKLALLYTKSKEANITQYPWWKQVLEYDQT
jgi:LmbE family N-acetylglucosaminyl deacetylase